MLKRWLHRLIFVYTCQKTTLLEISCRVSIITYDFLTVITYNVEGFIFYILLEHVYMLRH